MDLQAQLEELRKSTQATLKGNERQSQQRITRFAC